MSNAAYAYGLGLGIGMDASWASVPYLEGRKAKLMGSGKNPYSLGSQEHQEYELGLHSMDNPSWPHQK